MSCFPPSRRAGGQYHALEGIFVSLLEGGQASSASAGLKATPDESSGEDSALAAEVMEAEVRLLSVTLRIDHRVAESRLPAFLSLLMSRYAAMGDVMERTHGRKARRAYATALSCRQACLKAGQETVETYSRLRQLLRFLEASVEAAKEGAEGPEAMLTQPDLVKALGKAMEDCPPPQLVELWDFLAGVGGGNGAVAVGTDSQVASGVRAHLFATFLGSLRVSAGNAEALGQRAVAAMDKVRITFLPSPPPSRLSLLTTGMQIPPSHLSDRVLTSPAVVSRLSSSSNAPAWLSHLVWRPTHVPWACTRVYSRRWSPATTGLAGVAPCRLALGPFCALSSRATPPPTQPPLHTSPPRSPRPASRRSIAWPWVACASSFKSPTQPPERARRTRRRPRLWSASSSPPRVLILTEKETRQDQTRR